MVPALDHALNALAFLHRWLGIGGGALFVLWFASGIVMMSVRMPEVTPDERLARARPIDPARVRVGIGEASAAAQATPGTGVRLRMLGERPVYTFDGPPRVSVGADDGRVLGAIDAAQAVAAGRSFVGADSTAPSHAEVLTVSDQWTLLLRPHLPLHRLRVGDVADTELYVSSVTGEVVMRTTRRGRLLAYLGPIPHWLYVPALRRNGVAWTNVVIGVSGLGCIACLSGLTVGVCRLFAGRRRSDGRWFAEFAVPRMVALAPLRRPALRRRHLHLDLQRDVVDGSVSTARHGRCHAGAANGGAGPPDSGPAPDGAAVAAAVRVAGRALAAKEMTLIRVGGQLHWLALETTTRTAVVPAGRLIDGALAQFPRDQIETLARAAAPAPLADLVWLDDDDGYYATRATPRPLPVLRVRSHDRDATWIYLDPRTGGIALVLRRPDRVNRWLYNGLHSLDPAWLRHRRPLWDVTVIALSLGGLALALTSATPGWRRLRRTWRRVAERPGPAC